MDPSAAAATSDEPPLTELESLQLKANQVLSISRLYLVRLFAILVKSVFFISTQSRLKRPLKALCKVTEGSVTKRGQLWARTIHPQILMESALQANQ